VAIQQQSVLRILAGILMLTAVAGCTLSRGYAPVAVPVLTPAALSQVSLPQPAEAQSRAYLGLTDIQSLFSLADIKAEVIVIEIFDMYCAYCQKAAPTVNQFYYLIEKRGYADRIKLLGVGKLNSQFEINTFRDEYGLEFPIFPDPQRKIVGQLPHDVTPYFYIIQRQPDGSLRVLQRQRGGFPTAEEFLDAILKIAGMEPNPAASQANQNKR